MSSPEIIELSEDVSASPYYSADIAPTRKSDRKWGVWDFAALWIGMSACIPSYMLASGMILKGMNWYQAILTILLGNVIILIPLLLNAHAGTRYGITYPVYCRASFGIRGANFAALMRALVACGWFGILCWIGGQGLFVPLSIAFPSLKDPAMEVTRIFPAIADSAFLSSLVGKANLAEMLCFFGFWLLNIFLIYRGIESIRIFLKLSTPILIIVPVALVVWAVVQAGGIEPVLNAHKKLIDGRTATKDFWVIFIPSLTAVIGFWSTLALNIPDFSRYAKSQRAQALGQTLGLPTTMGLYGMIGVIVTSATIVIYGSAIWDPIKLLEKINEPQITADDKADRVAPVDGQPQDENGDQAAADTKQADAINKPADDKPADAKPADANVAKDDAANAAPVANADDNVNQDLNAPVGKMKKVPSRTPSLIMILVAITAAIALSAATLTTNIAANVVGPANDFANLFPKYIGVKTGGLITGIIGIAMQPWKLYSEDSYFTNWLNAYSILLGAIAGILIVDYYLIRKRTIVLADLYRPGGRYWYSNGINFNALLAFIAGVALCLPGYLQTNRMLDYGDDSIWIKLYHYGWFISLGIAGITYGVLMKVSKRPSSV